MSEVHASPARIRRAWRAGWRGRSSWLAAGITLLLAAVVSRSWTPDLAAPAASVRAALVGQGDDVLAFASTFARDALGLVAIVLALVSFALVLAALLLGRIGPIDRDAADGLGFASPPARMRVGLGLAVLVVVLALVELRGRVAGAARTADASADGLLALWHGSASQLATVLGLAMIAVGGLEAWSHRRDRLLALAPTPEQQRAEARERGGLRR